MTGTMAAILMLISVLLVLIWYRDKYSKLSHRYPNGPKPLPFMGNMSFFGTLESTSAQTLRGLQNRFGDVTMIWLGLKPALIVNSAKAATELLTKQSSIYSSRPEMNHFRKSLWSKRLVAMSTSHECRKHRRLFQMNLSNDKCLAFRKYQNHESSLLMQDLLETPESFSESIERYTMSVIFSIAYGVRLDELHHPVLLELHAIVEHVMPYFEPGSLAIDFIPFLEKIPYKYQPTLRRLMQVVSRENDLHRAFYDTLKKSHEDGSTPDCFGKMLIEQASGKESFGDDEAIQVLAGLITAGADTLSALFANAIKLLAMEPECLKAAQEEMDRVVGSSRLPTWDDQPNLPYTRAFIKEVHRYAPLGNLGIPHCAMRDNYYQGRFIPEGTIMFPNLPSISLDSSKYDQPSQFNPLRHMPTIELDSHAAARETDWEKRDHFHYGFGRRLCPGIHVAESSLFIVISRIIWGFKISQIPGEKSLDMSDRCHGLVWRPNPFVVAISPRNDDIACVIRQTSIAKDTDILNFDDVMRNIPKATNEQVHASRLKA